ncbi:hypothetical protein C8N44_13010 [Allosediminivita pacifica]|uniref:Uncharacterized protein n=1 Tax=Allosediminivita pacifica TaxID=1267769 RepID=A0A2T6ABR6_9RHOB|nr:hypothetical protein C8N44_13010 [Allosediminivita pacifica]
MKLNGSVISAGSLLFVATPGMADIYDGVPRQHLWDI